MREHSLIKASAGSVLDLLTSELEPELGWIGPPLIAPYNGIVLMGGLPKIGKSWITLELMRSLATGQPVFGNEAWKVREPARVLYVEQELGARSLKGRMSAVFNGLEQEEIERMTFVSKNDYVFDLATSEDQEYLRAYIHSAQPNVVIIDPLQEMHSAEENDATAMGKLGHYLKELVNIEFKHLDMTLMITHHFRKPPNDKTNWDPIDPNNFRGSGRLYGAPDSVITFHRYEEIECPDDPEREAWRMKCRMKLRHSESPRDSYLSFNEYGDLRVRWDGFEAPTGGGNGRPAPTRHDAAPDGGSDSPRPRFIAS